MPFCPNCGNQVEPQAKFCYSCGQALPGATSLQPPPPAPTQGSQDPPTTMTNPSTTIPSQPPPSIFVPSSEKIVGIVQNLKRPKSFGRWDLYALVVTDRRSIFAQITSDMLKEAAKQAAEQAKAEGKGWTQRWAAQLDASANYSRKYLNMHPDQIIRETPGNFALDNLAIIEIKVTSKRMRDNVQHYYEVEIKSSPSSFTYQTDYDSKDVLKQVYGEKVKTSFW